MSEATEFYDTEFEDSDEESLRSSLQLVSVLYVGGLEDSSSLTNL
jgi:hypothetical protein